MFSDNELFVVEEEVYDVFILVEDEVVKDLLFYVYQFVVEFFNEDQFISCFISRFVSIYKEYFFEYCFIFFEDVEEYEFFFEDDDKVVKKEFVKEKFKSVKKQCFFSVDIWEDVFSFVYYMVEVFILDFFEGEDKLENVVSIVFFIRDGEIFVQVFVCYQEELVEKEVRECGVDGFIFGWSVKLFWVKYQFYFVSEIKVVGCFGMYNCFFSWDVWEDSLEFFQFEIIVFIFQ